MTDGKAKPLLMSLLFATGVVVGVVAIFALNSTGRADPEIRDPHLTLPPIGSEGSEPEGHNHEEPAPDFTQVEAVGFTNAEKKLSSVREGSPFPLLLPAYLPEGLRLERFNYMEFGEGQATFSSYFTIEPNGEWRPAVHVWQTNREFEDGEPLAPGGQSGTIEVGAISWKYWLLSYPQVDGSVKELWDAHAHLADGISVTVDIRIGENPRDDERQSALSELTKVLESLPAQ